MHIWTSVKKVDTTYAVFLLSNFVANRAGVRYPSEPWIRLRL